MISLSVALMAHPKRQAQVEHVLKMLQADVPVVWDEINDRWDTGRRAMLAYDPECSHHLVIQDDVLLCRDLIPGVLDALRHMPDNVPLCLYMARRRPQEHFLVKAASQAEKVGASFITLKTLNWGPGIVVPTRVIPQMIDFCDPITEVPNYDKRLSRYWELKAHIRVWHTYPSLLDHADGPSLVAGRLGANREDPRHCRVAHEFLGEDRSALEINWNGPVVHAHGSFKSGKEASPITVSTAIMAHPKRQAQVEKTLERLGQRAMVIWDDKGDRWDTGRRAMQAYDPDCTHHLVLQDDVLVCNDLIPGVVEMLRYAPIDCPVSLYLGRHRRIPEATAEANAIGASFIEWSKLDHGLGVIVPTADIPAMLAFCDRSDIANYDARLSSYWEAQGRPTWYCQPSLIDHADGESLVPGRKAADHIRSQRVARRFVGEDCSALSVKWTGPVVHVDPPEPPPPPEPTVQAPWRNADMMAAAVSVKAPPHPPRPAPRLQSPCSIASANIRLSAAIMAHPSRSDYVERTLAKLDRATPVVWDEINDRWDTGRRAMLMADSRCTHHVVIQDDLLIPRDLLAGLERTLQHVPRGVPLCGYIGRVRPAADRMRELAAQADQKHASFVTLRQLLWGPLIVVPLEAVVPMITMCDHLDGITNYDLRLSRYWEEMNVRVWYTWPCVVDHADGPSLVPGRTGVDRAKPQPSRVAQRFCGENASVLDLDWSGPVIKGP